MQVYFRRLQGCSGVAFLLGLLQWCFPISVLWTYIYIESSKGAALLSIYYSDVKQVYSLDCMTEVSDLKTSSFEYQQRIENSADTPVMLSFSVYKVATGEEETFFFSSVYMWNKKLGSAQKLAVTSNRKMNKELPTLQVSFYNFFSVWLNVLLFLCL